MDNNVFTFENPSDSLMDFDYMDELLLDGCWLQATDASETLNNNPTPSNTLFDPSFQWPNLESNIGKPVSKDVFAPERNSPKSHAKNLIGLSNQSDNLSESSKRWWIPPTASSGPSLSVMERLIYAIDNIKHYTVDKNVLIQVWLPETKEGKKVLCTSQQLFSLELNCPRLSNYRSISESYEFPAEGNANESVGLPGRVFMGKVPEWTPDVRLFKIEEYPRVSHAQEQDVRGSVAVPVFDQDVKNCIGVVEVIMTTQKSIYALEIQSVCKALEAVDLRSSSSEDSNTHRIKVSNGFYHPALQEILETLRSACTMHNLPLAQTWTPCIQQGGKGGCRHSNENLVNCLSTVDTACYVSDPYFKEFQEACSEHHLFKGQGVVGRAFTTNEPCYSPDVTSYTKTQYPLAHHASYFDLHAAVAIRLRTTYGDMVDFVLEFFLPVECKNHEEQKSVINSLLVIIQKVCGSLRVVTEKELQEEAVNEGLLVSDSEQVQIIQETTEPGPGSGSGSGMEKRRVGAKMEKSITLEMLRQHFAGSLKDAAKNMGVCPTTLKRICRQHGIQRWPSRKIKKVGHSLRKIQLVMDSVHGGSGSFQIESFYSNFPKLASQDPSKTLFSATKIENLDMKVKDGTTTINSCSQSSSSSHSFSGGTHEIPQVKEDTTRDPDQDQDRDQDEDQERKLFLRSLNDSPKCQSRPPKPRVKREGDLWRVKVTFGEEKIRFRMQKDWGYNELLQEISKRFSLNDICGYQLRYLDDDSEWVLLTCDADVEECIDVYRSFRSGTIRLALREAQLHVGSSLGSNAPL